MPATNTQALAAVASLAAKLGGAAPWVVDGVTIPRPLTSRRTRLMCVANPTPASGVNPRWQGPTDPDAEGDSHWVMNDLGHADMVALGYEEAYMVYSGTLNLAPMMVQRDAAGNMLADALGRPLPFASFADFVAGVDLNWVSGNVNPITKRVNPSYCDPPEHTACRIAGTFAAVPLRFSDAPAIRFPTKTARPHLPLFFDLEDSFLGPAALSTTAGKIAGLQAVINAVQWVRETAGLDQEVYWYGHDYLAGAINGYVGAQVSGDPTNVDLDVLRLWRTLNMLLSGFTTMAYYWDWDAQNGGLGPWSWSLRSGNTWIGRTAPEFLSGPKIAVINPTAQIDSPQNDSPLVRAMAGKPIPFPIWKAGVDHAVEDGFELLLWYGGGDSPEAVGVRPHLAYLAQLGLGWDESMRGSLN